MMSDDDSEILLTQTKTSSVHVVEDWTDAYIHPEISEFNENHASDQQLSQAVDDAEVLTHSADEYAPVYKDISSTSDSEERPAVGRVTAPSPGLNFPTANRRFKAPKSDEDMKNYGVHSLAASSRKKCKWAAELFKNWQLSRNAIAEFDQSISAIKPALQSMTKDEVCYTISRFLCEDRKQSGKEYRYAPKTLYELVISLQLFLEGCSKCYKLLQDPTFLQLKNTLDHVMKERSREGITSMDRKAQVISIQEEDLLRKYSLGFSTPRKLGDTVLYLFGLHFPMRAGEEHRNLRWDNSELRLLTESNGRTYLRYTENVSKGNQGGLQHKK